MGHELRNYKAQLKGQHQYESGNIVMYALLMKGGVLSKPRIVYVCHGGETAWCPVPKLALEIEALGPIFGADMNTCIGWGVRRMKEHAVTSSLTLEGKASSTSRRVHLEDGFLDIIPEP